MLIVRSHFTKFSFVTVANGIYQNSVYGMAAKLPGKYTGAVILGTVSLKLLT